MAWRFAINSKNIVFVLHLQRTMATTDRVGCWQTPWRAHKQTRVDQEVCGGAIEQTRVDAEVCGSCGRPTSVCNEYGSDWHFGCACGARREITIYGELKCYPSKYLERYALVCDCGLQYKYFEG